VRPLGLVQLLVADDNGSGFGIADDGGALRALGLEAAFSGRAADGIDAYCVRFGLTLCVDTIATLHSCLLPRQTF